VRFVKQRHSEHRQVYFVTFDGSIPQLGAETHTFGYVYPLEREPAGGWRVIGGSGGAGETPARSSPWVNLGGGVLAHGFYAGGRIDSAGVDVARVQLRFADGLTLEDDTEESVALSSPTTRCARPRPPCSMTVPATNAPRIPRSLTCAVMEARPDDPAWTCPVRSRDQPGPRLDPAVPDPVAAR